MDFANRFCGFGKAKQKEARICPKSLMTAVVWTKSHEIWEHTTIWACPKRCPLLKSRCPLCATWGGGLDLNTLDLGEVAFLQKWGIEHNVMVKDGSTPLKNTQFQGIWGRGFLDGVQSFFFRCPCCCVSIVSFELFIDSDISGSGQFFGLLPMLFLENIWVIWAFFLWWGLESSQSKWDFFFRESVSL